MDNTLQILFYGDQSVECYKALRKLLQRSHTSYAVQEFLAVSWTALSEAVRDLPFSEKVHFSGTSFEDLEQSARRCERKSLAVTCVLHTVTRLGLTILHREQNPHLWRPRRQTRIMGLCTGIIPAIAASIAASVTELVQIGPDFVLLSLRMGLAAATRASSIEDENGSWATILSGVSHETGLALINDFNDAAALPIHQRLYVSARSASSFTVSGPPTTLQTFLTSNAIQPLHKVPTSIWGPFHAAHLALPDIDQFFSVSEIWDRTVTPEVPLLYPDMSDRLSFPFSLKKLLREALHDVLLKPIVLDDYCRSLQDDARNNQFQVTVIGPGRLGRMFDTLPVSSSKIYQDGESDDSSDHAANTRSDGSIAIVGMAGKFPGAEDLDQLWDIIVNGRDLHGEVPLSRFDVHTHCDPTGKIRNTSLTPYGCFYDNADKFDLALFKMSPREAAQTDPMQRLMLITAFMALEDAGYYDPGPRRRRPKYGTYYGQGGDDYRQMNSSQDINSNYITGGIRAFGPGRVSYHFGWEGPSMVIDTACSASGVAIHQAVSALRLRECDTALAGGANFLSCSDMFAGLSRASFLSLTGGCKTLDEQADGYCRADGVATVVLKRLEDAVQDKDNVLGVIRAIETNHAANAISITHPHADTQATLFGNVIRSAGLTVDDIDHVETHGTGTQAGDVAEMTSIASLLDGKRRPDTHPLYIGAVKPNIGHSEAASGVTSLIKGLLMFRNQIIPPHTGVKNRLNPKLPALHALNIQIPTQNLPYHKSIGSEKRRMLVNNFNATGGSTALVLEEHTPATRDIATDLRDYFPIVLSGATENALENAIKALHNFLLKGSDVVLSHLSYTLTSRRMHHAKRFHCTVASIPDLVGRLERSMKPLIETIKRPKISAVVFVFMGQGSHYAGMGHTLWATCQTFRENIKAADRLSQSLGFHSFLPLISDPAVDLGAYDVVSTQLALVTLETALARTVCSWGIEPVAVLGHSLGEYSALTVSGVLSLADTLHLVGRRAQLMLNKCEPGYAMLAVSTTEHIASKAIDSIRLRDTTVACINAPNQTVLSGPRGELEVLKDFLSNRAIKTTILDTRFAFHSSQLDPILPEIQQLATAVHFHAPKLHFASTLTGTVIEAGTENVLDAGYLVRQSRQPVQFSNALMAARDVIEKDESTVWIELGPTSTCISMIASTLEVDAVRLTSAIDKRKPNWQSMSETLGKVYSSGGDIFWDEYHKEYLNSLEFIKVPTYNFDMTSHFIPYTGDWAISKNQRSVQRSGLDHVLQSATIHRVDNYTAEQGMSKMTFSTQTSRPDFQDLLSSCTKVSIFAGSTCLVFDMVATAASCLWQHENYTETLPAIDILPVDTSAMVQETLLQARTIKLIATQDRSSKQIVKVSIVMKTSQGERCSEYRVTFDENQQVAQAANKTAYLYKSRINQLMNEVQQNVTNESFSDSRIRLSMDENGAEAVASVQSDTIDGHFALNPTWHGKIIGSLEDVLTFCREQHLRTSLDFHGWRSLRLIRKLEAGIVYYVHIRLSSSVSTDPISTDIHVLDKDYNIVAIFEDAEHSHIQRPITDHAAPSLIYNSPSTRKAKSNSSERSDVSPDRSLDTSTNGSAVSLPVKIVIKLDPITSLIAEEIGLDPSSIQEDTLLTDLGVDSLLQIGIAAKLKAYAKQELPESLLFEHTSIKKLREYFEIVAGTSLIGS